MEECPPKSYDEVAPLLLDLEHHTVLWTLLAGTTPGHIYVNDLENPTVAFAQFRHRAFISSSPDPELKSELRDFILSDVYRNCEEADVPLFRLTANAPAWLEILSESLSISISSSWATSVTNPRSQVLN